MIYQRYQQNEDMWVTETKWQNEKCSAMNRNTSLLQLPLLRVATTDDLPDLSNGATQLLRGLTVQSMTIDPSLLMFLTWIDHSLQPLHNQPSTICHGVEISEVIDQAKTESILVRLASDSVVDKIDQKRSNVRQLWAVWPSATTRIAIFGQFHASCNRLS